LVGDLSAAADRLGADVRDLIRLRHELGLAPRRRSAGRMSQVMDLIRKAVTK
jgi:hypothetical protein